VQAAPLGCLLMLSPCGATTVLLYFVACRAAGSDRPMVCRDICIVCSPGVCC
jgi:hypothetical protein